MKKKWGKRIGIGLGAVLGLLIVAMVVIPMVVDVDAYRPDIITAAEKQLNGKLELGKLKLSLWGQVRVDVEGFALSDAKDQKVVASKDVYFHVSFLSLLAGAPHVTLNLKSPQLWVVKNRQGQLNVMQLVKTSAPAAPGSDATAPTAEVPGLVKNARLGLRINDAQLSYEDAVAKSKSEFNNVNLEMKEVSLTRPSEVNLWGTVDSQVAGMVIKGPVRLTAKGVPELKEGQFAQSEISLRCDLSELAIEMPETFVKTKDIPAYVEGKIVLSEKEARLENMSVQFHNASVKLTGRVENALSPTEENPLRLDMGFESNAIALAPWKDLVVSLRPYDLTGEMGVKGFVKGVLAKLEYEARPYLKGMTLSGAQLKGKPKVEASALIQTDRVTKMEMWMTSPGNDLRVTGRVDSFTAPRFAVLVNSTGMDLDQLIKFPPKSAQQAAVKATPVEKPADLDALLNPLRKNEMAKKASGSVEVQIEKLKAYEVAMSQLRGKMTLQNLVVNTEKFAMVVFDGKMNAQSRVELASKMPAYDFKLDLQGLDLQKAVASQFNPFKNTLVGKANFQTSLKGQSFNSDTAKKLLKGSGKMRIDDAVFNTIDIGKVAAQAINSALVQVGDKVAQLKGKTVTPPREQKSEYQSVTGDFTLNDGLFRAPNFFAKAKEKRGIDIKGNTEVNVITNALRADWELIDTYNELRARDIGANIAGVQINHILAKGNEPVRFPIRVEGTVFAPQISYASVPGALVNVALGNLKNAGEAKAKAAVQNEVKKQAGNLLKGIFK